MGAAERGGAGVSHCGAGMKVAAMFLAAVVLTTVGAYGGQLMVNCDYNVYGTHGRAYWTASAGYTGYQFFGLVLQSTCLPAAAAVLILFAGQSYKLPLLHPAAKVTAYLLALFLLVLCASLSELNLTSHILECLWAFCFWTAVDDDDGIGAYEVTVGVLYFIACVAFALMMAAVVFKTFGDLAAGGREGGAFRSRSSQGVMRQPLVGEAGGAGSDDGSVGSLDASSAAADDWAPLPHKEAVRRQRAAARRRRAVKVVAVAAVFLLVFPLLIFVDMGYGDDWTDFTVPKIKSYATSSVTQAYGRVWNFAVDSSLILKLYPDILIFWATIYLVACAAVFAHLSAPFRRLLQRRIAAAGGKTVGEVLMWITFVTLLLGEALYWYLDHGWHSEAKSAKTWQERVARTLGQLANVTLALLALPVTRNGVFDTVFGVGWEAMVAFHRVMGYNFLALIFVHMCLWWKVYAQQGYFDHDWPIAIPMEFNSDNFTVPLATLTYWTLLVTHGLLALEWVRRNRFELFYYSHHFFLVLWVVVLWHAQSAWYYILASLFLWAVDRALRFARGLAKVYVSDLSVHAEVVRLAYKIEGGGGAATWAWPGGSTPLPLRHEPGQFVFLNVPALSVLEWHPFTISSAPGDELTTHHIKSMGQGTFTARLAQLAADLAGDKGAKAAGGVSAAGGSAGACASLVVNVDGPYGLPPRLVGYERIVFVAGGIGVTPCHGLYRHLATAAAAAHSGGGGGGILESCRSVHLIWVTRHPVELELFADSLRACAAADPRFTADLYLTRHPAADVEPGGREGGLAGPGVALHPGRPDLAKSLGELDGLGSRAMVFACGPATLKRAAMDASLKLGVEYHEETFEL